MKKTLSLLIKAVVLCGFLSVYATYQTAFAATFTVTNVNDSGPGSLRQAILDANVNGEIDLINFSIGTGVRTISPLSPLPTIKERTTIDATTQPGYAGKPIIEIEGSHAGATNGFLISAGFSTIKGVVINRFAGGGIFMFDTNGNVIEGNYIGTDVTGNIDRGNSGGGIGSDFNIGFHVIRGNVISGNGGNGIDLRLGAQSLVEDNLIGTDASGSFALGNDLNGIRASDQTLTARRNIISGNGLDGIFGDVRNVIQGNLIGTDVTGTLPIGNGRNGVRSFADQVGGLNAGEGNTIAFNGGAGVFVPFLFLRTSTILSNSIFSNGGLGIDLKADGVSVNDLCDADSSTVDAIQNFPALTSAFRSNNNTVIEGALNSTPNSAFTIQFFSNVVCDPLGFGEGQRLIGTISVTTGSSCTANFVATFPNTSVIGMFITATATNSANSTSEFSQCVAVTNPDPLQAIQALISDVESLVAQGILNHGNGNALISKLEAARKQLERGHIRPAGNQINAFINQVEALMRSKKLTPQQGQPLIDAAMNILRQIAA
ncbi:MAG TPA: right-handed parallel beta-helix repeat-containing protein [Blastocatellia bacterium]|nr:right-handed parallel beta-helix repeat-containing protein [Blastocatellia bacterium]